MANNYLRYKYYLITRASAEEINTVIEDILMDMGFKSSAKLDSSHRISTDISLSENVEILPSVAELMKVCPLITGEVDIAGQMKVSPSDGEEARIGSFLDLKSEMKCLLAHSPSVENALAYTIATTAKVLQHIFFETINLKNEENVEISMSVGGAVKTGTENSISSSVTPSAKMSEPEEASIHGDNTETVTIVADSATPLKHSAYIGVIIPVETITSIYESVKAGMKSANTALVSAAITMFRRTLLSDFDAITVSEMDDSSLEELYYTEQTN